MTERILLVGASGVFGSRLALMLSRLAGVELVLAARDVAALEALKSRLEAGGAAAPIAIQVFDRQQAQALASLAPWLVIDAAGPFQHSDYSLPLAALQAGAHYIDLADSRAFVGGFEAAAGEAARAAGLLAVTGASSTPALSHAALAVMTRDWRRIDSILTAISPGARAPRGLSVVRAILSYVGRPVRVFRGGAWGSSFGWASPRRLWFPGVGRRWASVCETPDLDLLPARFPVQDGALFLAGLTPWPIHLGLWALSWLVRFRIAPSLAPLAKPLRALAALFAPFGSDLGGMIVEARGADADGEAIRARWSLWAAPGVGPNTPAAPAAALARLLLERRETRRGAFDCGGFLQLDDILAEMSDLPIGTRFDEGHPQSPVLFRRLLGRRFDALPAPVRAIHGSATPATFEGAAVTHAGRSLVARSMRLLLGLPRSGRCDVQVRFTPDPVGETWTRRFGTAAFSSRLVSTTELGVFEERIGPLRFRFELLPTPRGVAWKMLSWRLLGLPLPAAIGPKVLARAEDAGGRYRFRVAVIHPWFGLMFAYRGVLTR